MARRAYRCEAHCHHEGCDARTFWICESNEEYLRVERQNARNWKCLRHTNLEEVLSISNRKTVYEIASDRRDYGVFWGNSGFVHGPGFKAWPEDFPDGTKLRVTAEIVNPEMELREKLARYLVQALLDPAETTDKCVNLATILVNAMNWSPETEKLVIEQMRPVCEEMARLACEANPGFEILHADGETDEI